MLGLRSLTPRDVREESVIAIWRSGRLASSTIAGYLEWVRRWCAYWRRQSDDDTRHLTSVDVVAFAAKQIAGHKRRIAPSTRANLKSALHAWSCALEISGQTVPCWRSARRPVRLSAVLQAYVVHRQAHRGVVAGTARIDVKVASEFIDVLRSRRRTISTARIADVDRFVDGMLARYLPSTVSDRCSSLRAFLRFLRATGRLHHDLASSVAGPRVRAATRPPRALPWTDIRRMLRFVPRREPLGLRDHAMLLLLASYGMGAMEVAQLRLDDIDWVAKTLRVRRQKTDTAIVLPLSPSVARAIAAYLLRGRAQHSKAREVFLTIGLPHRAVSSGIVVHQVRRYATLAGIPAHLRGSHVFRHSHATRQIDLGANPKIVSDILGHRRPSSTSVYVRVALRRLRALALPVPR